MPASPTSLPPQDLPVVVRFLLSSAPQKKDKTKTLEILTAIREHLSNTIESGGELLSDEKAQDAASIEALFLESLRIGLRQRGDIAALYLKDRQASDCSPCRALDVWLLAAMHGFPRDRKVVESTLKKLVIARKLDLDTVEHAIAGHHRALQKNFEALVSMASVLVGARAHIRITSEFVHACGRTMFLKIFDAFKSSYHRQEVVGRLMTHIGSGSRDEIDTAIAVFVTMVDDDGPEGHAKCLAPFSAFLRCLIDYVEHLSLDQVRKIFYVLSTLAEHANISDNVAHAGGGEDAQSSSLALRPNMDSGDAELMILLRKMLASTQSNYRAIGVVAGSAMVMAICGATPKRRSRRGSKDSQLSGRSPSQDASDDEDYGDTESDEDGDAISLNNWESKAMSVLQQILKAGRDSTSLQVCVLLCSVGNARARARARARVFGGGGSCCMMYN